MQKRPTITMDASLQNISDREDTTNTHKPPPSETGNLLPESVIIAALQALDAAGIPWRPPSWTTYSEILTKLQELPAKELSKR